ncbi:MAG: murein biosynthesis integral membrane protein MurJ [Gemmatimonadota bacterium]|nr:murein biosynthesis integral membrane protein MurJ [Gemmatimonadota bacterium]
MTTERREGRGTASTEGRGANRVAGGIFVSRVLGLVRDRAFAYYFGSSDFADAWRAALRTPNVVQNLLGEGTLSASLVPVYSEMVEQGREAEAGRFAGAALGILTVVAASAVLVGWTLAPAIVSLFFPTWDPAKQTLTTTLVRILFPMTGILVLSAWALGILNSHRRFFVSYVAPAFWNVAMITAMVGGAVAFGLEGEDLVVALAWGALAGGGLQLGWQVPFLFRHLKGFVPSVRWSVKGVPEAVRNFVPVVAARGVVNVSGWIDLILAGRLTGGAVAVLGYAQTFYMLPISLFGMSIAASELPELSRMRGEAQRVVADRVSSALVRVSYFLVPSVVLYVTMGDVVVAALYQTGAFGAPETLVTWAVLAGYALGLPASAGSRLLSSAFYALRDARTPARIAYVRVLVSTVTGVVLMIPLDRLGFESLRLGAAGLALGASVGAWLEYVLLRRSLGARVGTHGPGTGPVVGFAFAAAIAAAVAAALQGWVGGWHPVLAAAATLVPAGLAYMAIVWAVEGRHPGSNGARG